MYFRVTLQVELKGSPFISAQVDLTCTSASCQPDVSLHHPRSERCTSDISPDKPQKRYGGPSRAQLAARTLTWPVRKRYGWHFPASSHLPARRWPSSLLAGPKTVWLAPPSLT